MFCTTHQIVTTVEPPEICRNDSNIYDVLKFEKKHQKSEIKMPNGPPSQIFNEKATFFVQMQIFLHCSHGGPPFSVVFTLSRLYFETGPRPVANVSKRIHSTLKAISHT